MKKKFASLLLTALMCLAGMNAWALDQVDGVYQIGTAQDLLDFAALVNGGTGGANAVLTADIDMADKAFTPIGQDGKDYAGHFDGQGHRILNLTTNAGNNNQALFGQAVGGAVIENIIIDKSCTIQGAAFTAGILGHVWGDGVIVRNCGNEANINGSEQNSAGIVGCSEKVVTISNCYNTGTIKGARENAGICGWMGSSSSVIENCFSIATDINGEAMYRNGGATATNLFQIEGKQGTAFTSEQLSSGELCYLLNGKNPDGPWRQNIGTDDMPKPFGTEKVYANGTLKCDGTSAGGDLTYSNSSTSVIPPHTRDASTGFCSVCGTFFSDNFTPVDGTFEIDTPAKLYWFAKYVAEVEQNVNAKLTADIDYTAYHEGYIGSSQAKAFKGVFDGQGHKVTIDLVDAGARTGLFAYIYAATIRDLEVAGTINMSSHNCAGGIGGRSDGDGTLIRNVVSSVTINDAQGGDGTLGGLFANMENKYTVENCAFYGTINAPNRDSNGGLVGWAGSGSNGSFINCIVAPASISWKQGATIARNTPTINKCYATDAANGDDGAFKYAGGATVGSVTTAELSNPSYVFNTLNGVSTTPWRLTIGTDTKPYSLSSHSIVYANGVLRCDGTPIGGDITYSNAEAVVPDHTFGANGMCSVCNHAGVEPTLTDGAYQIANIGNLYWFSNYVNDGNTAANAALTADVEQGTVELQPIGNSTNLFKGTFDGMSHSVTLNLNNASSDYQGLFGAVTGGATFKNLIVKGSVKGKDAVGGIVGGSTGGGTIAFTNCGNEAAVTTSGANGAGLFGVNMGSAATVTFTNCYNTGDITSGREGGAISGWIGDGSKGCAVTNCFNTGKITNGDFVRSNSGKLTNTYDKRNNEAMIASGELCFLLNGSSSETPVWFQALGTDAHPVFAGETVYKTSNAGWATFYDASQNYAFNGVKAYTGKVNGEYLTLTEVSQANAGTAVVLEGTYYNKVVKAAPAEMPENDLKGAATDVTADGSQYVLAVKDEVIGFYQATDGTIAAGKAYLTGISAGVKAITFGTATSIVSPLGETEKAPVIYDLSGRRVEKATKGLYIINGKKVLK